MPTLIKGSPHVRSSHPPNGETDQVRDRGGCLLYAGALVLALGTGHSPGQSGPILSCHPSSSTTMANDASNKGSSRHPSDLHLARSSRMVRHRLGLFLLLRTGRLLVPHEEAVTELSTVPILHRNTPFKRLRVANPYATCRPDAAAAGATCSRSPARSDSSTAGSFRTRLPHRAGPGSVRP